MRAAERGLRVLAGSTPDEMRSLVADALETALRPLVYAEPLQLLRTHRERGEAVYIVSATLQEIVDTIAADLGFDGGIGSVCELGDDGRYTGRAVRILHGPEKAAELRELASSVGLDLSVCTAYSDSHTDLPFLEAVGHPVAVNPDRRLRRVASRRGWPVLTFKMRHAA
jgi:HAD superfamily hydrolase (TIGR01490 family)